MAKAFDTSCPVSAFIPPDSLRSGPDDVQLECKVNGEVISQLRGLFPNQNNLF